MCIGSRSHFGGNMKKIGLILLSVYSLPTAHAGNNSTAGNQWDNLEKVTSVYAYSTYYVVQGTRISTQTAERIEFDSNQAQAQECLKMSKAAMLLPSLWRFSALIDNSGVISCSLVSNQY